MKTILKINNRCNNNCLFCHAKDRKGPDISLDSLSRKAKGDIILSGGEPTIHKEFFSILHLLKESNVSIVTNARMMSNKEFARSANKYIDEWYVSVFTVNEKTYKEIARCDGLKQMKEGLKNISGKIIINITVIKQNLSQLKDIINYISEYNPKIRLCLVKPIDSSIKPDYWEAVKLIEEALEYGTSKGLDVHYDRIPLCHIDSKFTPDGFAQNDIVYLSQTDEDQLFEVDADTCQRGPECRFCQRCEGLYKEYGKVRFHPIVEDDETFEFCLYDKCNNDCKFCNLDSELDKVFVSTDFNEQLKVAKDKKKISLSGGEPTLDPELFNKLDEIFKIDAKISFFTNGIKLAEKAFADRLLQYPFHQIAVSLISTDNTVHRSITGNDNTSVLKAIKNLLAARLRINIPITDKNVNSLLKTMDDIKSMGYDGEFLVFDTGLSSYDEFLKQFGSHRIRLDSFPFCLFPDIQLAKNGLNIRDDIYIESVGKSHAKVYEKEGCKGCALYKSCFKIPYKMEFDIKPF